jgi:hypothetical protein
MDWKEIGAWAIGVIVTLVAGGLTIKFGIGGKNKQVSTTINTQQNGNVVDGDMAGRDNISNHHR